MATKGPGRAICPDGRPADLVIEEDGTTWLRIEGMGLKCWANLDKLRAPVPAPPVADWMWRKADRLPDTTNLHTLRADYMAGFAVRDPGFNLRGFTV